VAAMMDKWFGVEGAINYLPEQVGLRFTGPASALKLDRSTVDRLVGDVAKQRGTEAISGLLGGGKKGEKNQPSTRGSDAQRLIDRLGGKADNSSTKPSQPTPESIGGSLLDMLGGKRDKK